jgi:hypothetical protein
MLLNQQTYKNSTYIDDITKLIMENMILKIDGDEKDVYENLIETIVKFYN